MLSSSVFNKLSRTSRQLAPLVRSYSTTARQDEIPSNAKATTTSYIGCPTVAAYTQARRLAEPVRRPRVQQPDTVEFKVGDLVQYNMGGATSEGLVASIITRPFTDEIGRTHYAGPGQAIAQVQNQYTRNLVYQRISGLRWLARKEDGSLVKASATTKPPQTNTPIPPTQNTNNTTKEDNSSSKTTKVTPPSKEEKEQTHSPIKEISESDLVEKKKASCSLLLDIPPVRAEFAPGDLVRYHAGRSITAGLIQGVYFSPQYDAHGAYQGATKKNPMAKITNLWTKNAVFHHFNALELVQRAETSQTQSVAQTSYDKSDMTAHTGGVKGRRLHA